ncbi:MAG: sodium:proton antiporter [Bdellovibrionota bacterium]
MNETIAFSLCLILFCGVLAQWLAWRLGIPSILLLLLTGIALGPLTGVLSPDALFGPMLLPLVSVLVCIVLFEGGLNLRTAELRKVGRPFVGLATVGVLTTFLLSSLGAIYFLELPAKIATLFGAILIVTGPTVVIPLLQHARPSAKVASILRWEAIALDPVGAIFAVLVYETFLSQAHSKTLLDGIATLGIAIVVGAVSGGLGALMMLRGIRGGQIPEHLQNPAILATVLASYAAANTVQSESGLFAVTIFGAILGNQSEVELRHVVRFKETLSTLFLAILFILLGARLTMQEITGVSYGHLLFVLFLIFVVRPSTVFLSTFRSGLELREKVYLSGIAPRGIVAAAVCSVFALKLRANNIEAGEQLVPAMFTVILSTVTLSGILAAPLARRLKLVKEHPQGIVFLGSEPLTRAVAKAVKDAGFEVLLVENDWTKVTATRMEGLPTIFGDILSTGVGDALDLSTFGQLCAMSSDSSLNALACVRFRRVFGPENVYQLPPPAAPQGKKVEIREKERGRYLFGEAMSFRHLRNVFGDEPLVKTTKFTNEFTYQSYLDSRATETAPLFLIAAPDRIVPITAEQSLQPSAGQGLVSLIVRAEASEMR